MRPHLAFIHRDTPEMTVVEPRGLAVRSVDYYRAVEGADAEARVNRTVHDPVGRVIAQSDPRLFLYATAPANLVTIHGLSGTALCTLSVDAGLHVSLFGEAGQPVHSWDGRGSQHWMHYDNQLRLTALFEQAAEGEAFCAERLTYAANDQAFADHNQCGRLICHEDPAGAVLFNDYGLSGAILEQERCFAKESSPGFATHSRFNPLNDLLSRTDAQGNEQRFSQTVGGHLCAVDLRLNNTLEWLPMVSAITYNAHGQVEREVAGNGVITTLEYATEDGRLKRLLSRLGQDDPLQDLRYTYDPVGNVRSIEDAALPIRYFANQRIEPVSHYFYDTLYRLIEATGWEAGWVKHGPSSAMTADPAMPGNYRQTYRYDAGNNLLELTHVGPQNHGHRLVADAHSNRCLLVRDGIEPGEEDFRNGFDANGNLLKLQPGRTLHWDVRNQLCEVRPVEHDGAESDSERYVYGADGMRVCKVRSLQTNARTVVAQTLYLPALEIRTHSGTGEVLHVIEVATGRGSVRVLHWEAGIPNEITNNQQRYSLTDHLGSSTLELDQDASLITQERYYPFGGTAWSNGMAVQVSYKTVRYSGKEQDATGLYYYGFRYYMPWLQRWLNPDPAGTVDGLNLYRMIRNAPINEIDVMGLASSGNFNGLRSTFASLRKWVVSKWKGGRADQSRKPSAPGPSASVYDRAIFTLAQREGKASSIADLNVFKGNINNNVAQQNLKIEGFLYRSHHVGAISSTGLIRANGAAEPSGDEFFAQIFQHSGMQSGLAGKVLSFTPDINVARRFSKRDGNILVRVNTRSDSVKAGFRTTADIVLTDAERLIEDRVIRIPSLVNVLGYLGQGEIETFYMGGDIPSEAVQVNYEGGWISVQEYENKKSKLSARFGKDLQVVK